MNLDSQADGPVPADEQGGFLARVDAPDLLHALGPAHRDGVLKALPALEPGLAPNQAVLKCSTWWPAQCQLVEPGL